ncbi:MAG TPA: tyrosine-type recombinase/integrase, partial [Flavobacteriales bacterium]|nr:tyrosine-type recombinase/integrase [Flavobacteriales bacterium]
QGTTTKELDTLLIQDIDLHKATINIRGGRKSNDRTLPLKAEQIGQLMHYRGEIRPKLLAYHTKESEKLFLPLPTYSQTTTGSDKLMHVFKPLTKHLRSIEPAFVNFKQIRASVITHWLKAHGLRKTQYLAGHRYISSTESYQLGNLEGLAGDIAALHPFA